MTTSGSRPMEIAINVLNNFSLRLIAVSLRLCCRRPVLKRCRPRFSNRRIGTTIKAMPTAQNSAIRNIPPLIRASGHAQTPTLTPPLNEIERINFVSLPSSVCLRHAIPCFQPIFTRHQFIG